MDLSLLKRKLLFLTSKYYVMVVIALILFTLIGGYFLFVKDKIVEIQQVGLVDLQSTFDTLDSKKTTLTRLESLHAQYSKITKDQIQQLSYVLPSQPEIPYIVIEIKNFVKDNDLLLGNIDVGPLSSNNLSAEPAEGGTIKELKISLSISGIDSYFKLKNFLDNLSTQLPLLELTSLVYTPGTDLYSLNLTTYYQ